MPSGVPCVKLSKDPSSQVLIQVLHLLSQHLGTIYRDILPLYISFAYILVTRTWIYVYIESDALRL
jgi:hypothetical protein